MKERPNELVNVGEAEECEREGRSEGEIHRGFVIKRQFKMTTMCVFRLKIVSYLNCGSVEEFEQISL